MAIKAVTQYGKSEVTALALIRALHDRREKALIVSPSNKQAMIIMGYVIQHLFDTEYSKMMIEWTGSLERLKHERSKRRITFKETESEVFILTADARTVSQEAKSLMGFGATIVVIDETALLPDPMFAKVLRMVGGGRGRKLVQIGNPFDSAHFKRAFASSRYEKLTINYKQALKEGRLTEEFLDEAREEMSPYDFGIFYECGFPKEGAVNALIPADWIDLAINQKEISEGDEKSGLDVARFGDDKTVYCFRSGGIVKRLTAVEKRDTMEVVGWARNFLDEDEPENLAIDTVGIGSGVYDRLKEEEYDVTDVNVGRKPIPTDELDEDEAKKKFYNLKAQMAWRLREWFKPKEGKSDISIPDDPELIKQLKEIRYNYDSSKRIKIESKEDLKKRIGQSPDKADALMLAFCDLTDETVEMYIV